MTLATRTLQAHLILLHGGVPPSQAEIDRVVAGRRAQLRCPTTMIAVLPANGSMPTGPDSYVIAIALMACQNAGVDFDDDRGDQIGYQRLGDTGLITVFINH